MNWYAARPHCPDIATTRFHRYFFGGGCAARLACPSRSASHTFVRFHRHAVDVAGGSPAFASVASACPGEGVQKSRTTGTGFPSGPVACPVPVKAIRPLAALIAAPFAVQSSLSACCSWAWVFGMSGILGFGGAAPHVVVELGPDAVVNGGWEAWLLIAAASFGHLGLAAIVCELDGGDGGLGLALGERALPTKIGQMTGCSGMVAEVGGAGVLVPRSARAKRAWAASDVRRDEWAAGLPIWTAVAAEARWPGAIPPTGLPISGPSSQCAHSICLI